MPGLRFSVIQSYVIGIRFQKDGNGINNPSYKKQSPSKHVQKSHSPFSFIEFMNAYPSEKQTQKECCPFVTSSSEATVYVCVDICINVLIIIIVAVIDDDLRLRWLRSQLLHLLAAFRANDAVGIDLRPAVFAELQCVPSDTLI